MRCLTLVPDCSLIYCDSRETDGCSGPIRGPVKVMSSGFFAEVENQPSKSNFEASLRETKSSARAKPERIIFAVLDLPWYDFFPIFSAAHRVNNHHLSSPSNGCPVSRVDELDKAAAMMIKCENESGKLDEVR